MTQKNRKENLKILWLFLGLGFVLGVVYLFLLPPWQHYDEQNHFEKVWLQTQSPGNKDFNQKYNQFKIDDYSFRRS